jgi:hypothetical protein
MTWFVVQSLQPNGRFSAEFSQKHGVTFTSDQVLYTRTKRCQCPSFDLGTFLEVTRRTGIAVCPNCGIPVRIPDLIAEVKQRSEIPRPKQKQAAIVPSHTVFTPIDVEEENPEDIEARWNAHNLLCSLMRGKAEPKRFLLSIPRVSVVDDPGQPINEAAPESMEEFNARIDEFMGSGDWVS